MLFYDNPKYLKCEWNKDAKAVIDTWTDYGIPMEEFSKAVLDLGVSIAKEKGGIAWIVDSSQASGVFPPHIQKYINDVIFPAFFKNGIQYFFTIDSSISPLTNVNVKTFQAKTAPNGLILIEMASKEEAISWLRSNTIKRTN